MIRTIGAAGLLALAFAMPTQQAAAQDPLAGAILGGAAGAIIGGGMTGRAGGAAIGALIGASTGAIIASEAQRSWTGYYYWRNGCYMRDQYGRWYQIDPGYCY